MTEDGEMGLAQESALEVLAFLVTAARTQTEEAAEYGPLRLLMGARLLAERIAEQVPADDHLHALVAEIAGRQPVRTPTRDRDTYLASLNTLCERVADTLLARQDAREHRHGQPGVRLPPHTASDPGDERRAGSTRSC